MRKIWLAGALLVLTVGSPGARAQEQQPPPRFQVTSSDLALTYTTEQAKAAPNGSSFWMQGASLDGAFTFFHGFGLASNLTGDYAPNITPGVGVGNLTFGMGPRYTYNLRPSSKHETRVFGEVLAGAVKGFGSLFPTPTGLNHRATAFSWQAGGGVDLGMSKHWAIRIEADYVRSYLPNNALDKQDQVRLAVGVTYHIGSH